MKTNNTTYTRYITADYDAPSKLMATIVDTVMQHLPILHMTADLTSAATEAATARENCVAHPCKPLDDLQYPHLVSTNKGRCAISACHLLRPGNMVAENGLNSEELAQTCFISDFSVALFLKNMISDDGIAARNKFTFGSNHEILVQDGPCVRTLSQILSSATKREQTFFRQAAIYQLALCQAYEALASQTEGRS